MTTRAGEQQAADKMMANSRNQVIAEVATNVISPQTEPSTDTNNTNINNNQQQQQLSSSALVSHLQAAARAQTHTLGVQVRAHMTQASDQLGHSLRQLYASASSIAAAAESSSPAAGPPPPLYQNLPGVVPYYQGRSVGPPPSYDDVINPYAAPPSYQSLFGQMRAARKTSRGLLDLLRRLLIILASTLGCTLLIAVMILIPFTMIIVGAIYIDECKIEHIPAFLLVGGLVWASKNILHCYSQCRKQSQAEQTAARVADQLYAAATRADAQPGLSLSSSASNSSRSSSASSNSVLAAGQQASTIGPDTVFVDQFGLQLDHDASRDSTLSSADTGSSWRQEHVRSRRHLAPGNAHHTQRLKSSICESLLNCVLFGWFVAGCVIVFRNYEPDFENTQSVRYCHRTVYMYTFWLITSAMLLFGLFISSICCLMISSAVASRQDELDLA